MLHWLQLNPFKSKSQKSKVNYPQLINAKKAQCNYSSAARMIYFRENGWSVKKESQADFKIMFNLDFSSELKILFIIYSTRTKWTHLEQSCRCLFQLWCWLKSSSGKTKIDWISNSIDKEFCRIWTGNWISERNYSKWYTDHLKELLTDQSAQ